MVARVENLTIKRMARTFLPERTRFIEEDDVISVVSPGRKLLLRYLSNEQVGRLNRRKLSGPDYTEMEDHNPDDVLDSVAWNVLLLSLVTWQEALLDRFHSVALGKDPSDLVSALRDFDDFYDDDLFELPNSAGFQDSFNVFKAALDLDRQYEMLHRKLDIAIGKVHSDSLSWLVFSLIVAVMAATFEMWHDVRTDVSLALPVAAAAIAVAFIALALHDFRWRISSTIRSRILRLTGLRGTAGHRWKVLKGLVACFFQGDSIAKR